MVNKVHVGFSPKAYPVARQSASLFDKPATGNADIAMSASRNIEHPTRPFAKNGALLINFGLDLHLMRAKLGKIQPQHK
jgi:hypothetical protein